MEKIPQCSLLRLVCLAITFLVLFAGEAVSGRRVTTTTELTHGLVSKIHHRRSVREADPGHVTTTTEMAHGLIDNIHRRSVREANPGHATTTTEMSHGLIDNVHRRAVREANPGHVTTTTEMAHGLLGGIHRRAVRETNPGHVTTTTEMAHGLLGGIHRRAVREANPGHVTTTEMTHGVGGKIHRHAKPPVVHTAPLDPNESVHHTLDEVTQILGTLGHTSSGAVMGLTGIAITDCASSIKNEDLRSMTCAQFIGKLSKCDSMAHVKPLLHQAKQKQKKNPNSKEPCFNNKKRGRKG